MEYITSKTNSLIKHYVRLRDQKKARYAEQCFVVETAKLLQEAVAAGVLLQVLLVTEEAFVQHEKWVSSILENASVQVVRISDEIEEKLTQTANAGGLFAICKMLDKPVLLNTIKTGGRFVYLSRLQDSGNVGTIIRTALALGLSGILISPDCCDVYSLKVLRASMGGVFRLPIYDGVTLAQLSDLQERFVTYAAVVEETADAVTTFRFAKDSIVVIGNEGNGLDEETISACQKQITIQMKGAAESLNAGMAAGILMWEQMKD